jgi:hypothetical protein
VLNQQVDRSVLTQIRLPYPMPSAVSCALLAVPSCANCAPADFMTSEEGGDDVFATCLAEQCAGSAGLGVCERCVHLLDYDEFLQGVLSSAKGGKGYGRGYKRRKTDNNARGRRKTAAVADEAYLPSARAGRASGEGAAESRERRCASRAGRSVGHHAMAAEYAADSALLLSMRRARSDKFSDDSSDSTDCSDSGACHVDDADTCYGEDEFAVSDRSVTGYKRKLGRNASVELATPVASPTMSYTGCFSRPSSTAPEALLPESFHPLSNTYRATGGGPPGFLMTGAGSGSSGLAISTISTAEDEEAHPDEGRALQDFLTACYRDGMYPSPVLSAAAAQHAQHPHLHFYFGAQTEPAAHHQEQAADEGRGYLERSAGTETDTEWAGTSADDHPYQPPARPEADRDNDNVVSSVEMMVASEESDHSLVGHCNERANRTDSSGVPCLEAPAFAYEELQLLLSQLLHESAGKEGVN